jgi:hypothetical protein
MSSGGPPIKGLSTANMWYAVAAMAARSRREED